MISKSTLVAAPQPAASPLRAGEDGKALSAILRGMGTLEQGDAKFKLGAAAFLAEQMEAKLRAAPDLRAGLLAAAEIVDDLALAASSKEGQGMAFRIKDAIRAKAEAGGEEQCSYCKVWYPRPVSFHHDTDECHRNEAAERGREGL